MLGAVALWWFKFASDELKAMTEETLAPIVGSLRSTGEWLVEAVMRLKEKATGGASLGMHTMHMHFSLYQTEIWSGLSPLACHPRPQVV